ncbi:ABC transporter substrate-binding protein [Pseudonocardia sp. CA-107938]|uniref:ABC transporter substrate-binding protein n=1 Tax=Pseudonocardia sp. CA-107938 TaxID=3240021 RepID=UPI003D9228C4
MSRSCLRTAFAAVAAAAALLVAGCGGAAAPPAASPSAGGTFPVTVQHKFGSTTIPAKPVRVVTLGYTDQDAVLALGTVPVATSEWYGEKPGALFPWAAAKLNGAPLPAVIPSSQTVQFEKVASYRPDLILDLYGGLEQGDYDKLSAIAPTIAQPAGVPNYAIPWDVQTEVIGQALGKPAEAAALVKGVKDKIAQVKAVHPQYAGRTALTAGWFSDKWYGYATKDQRGRLLTDLGLTVNPEIDKLSGDDFGAYVSFERPDLIDADALIWVMFEPGQEAKIKASPSYATTRAATQGRAIYIDATGDSALDAMGGFITVLSLPGLLDALPPKLDALLDGDPATN